MCVADALILITRYFWFSYWNQSKYLQKWLNFPEKIHQPVEHRFSTYIELEKRLQEHCTEYGNCSKFINFIFLNQLSKEERIKEIIQATEQRKMNVSKSFLNVNQSVHKLSMKSYIHNRRISKKQEAEYRQKIVKWFTDIYKIAPEMLDVSASCDSLKIIFDFESDFIENVSTESSQSSKWIFIGAKVFGKDENLIKQHEQLIKGALAHELCHFVMEVVYENQGKPYYKNRKDMKDKFEEIVKTIDKWSSEGTKGPDDECNGIISTVFTTYPSQNVHSELIVRPVHIMAQFDDNLEHSEYLIDKYQVLFNFRQAYIVPELQNYVLKITGNNLIEESQNFLKLFQQNYFEVDLKEKLGLDAVYKLDENGINLIASSWLFDELHDKGENLNEMFGTKHSQKLQKYKIMAKKLCEKIPKSQSDSIGLPQFYKMIADITKNNKDSAINFTTFKIFEECVDIQYERWLRDKGELRSKANTDSQHFDLNFHKLHQLVAMESLFPNESNFCGLSREDLKQWIDEEIIACAMLNKKSGKYLFSHETFREYYAAKFILEKLTKYQHLENVCKFLSQFLTAKKFGIIRMFLNDALGDKNYSEKIMLNILGISKNLDNSIQEFETSSDIFEENFPNLADFIIKIFTHSNKEKVKNILLKNQKITLMASKHTNLFIQTQNIILENFNEDELKDFLLKNGTFLSIIVSIPDSEIVDDFINCVKHKTKNTPDFISQALKIENDQNGNIFFRLFRSENSNSEKFKKIMEILKENLKPDEIIDLAKRNNNQGINALQLIFDTKNEGKMQFMWTELEKIFESSANPAHNITDFYSQEKKENFLHIAAQCTEIKFHETLWELLLNTFENREELKELIMQGDKYGDNYVHLLVIYDYPEIIEFTIWKIKENFNNDQYEEILKSKGKWGRNLLQVAACNSKDIKTHQFLWKIFRDFFKSDATFLEFLKEVDNDNCNVFHIAAAFTSKEIFEFMMVELEKIASNEDIRTILRTFGKANRNLLQSAAIQNKSIELHEYLWTIMKKYFNSQEILDMIKHADQYGDNLLFDVVECNTKEVLELTWNEIKNIINKTKNTSTIEQHLSCINNNKENIVHVLIKSKNSEKLKYFWPELEKYFTKPQLRNLLSHKTSEYEKNVLHYAANCTEIEFHETLWELLLNTFENREELKKLIMQSNKYGNNYVHCLVIYNKPAIIEFTIMKIKENFNNEQYEEILKSKGQSGRNLLQRAACSSKDIKTHQILWKIFRDLCKSNQELLEFLKEVDNENNNVFHIAAAFTSKEIFEFMINQLEKTTSNEEEIRNILRTLGEVTRNLLQSAVIYNKSVKLHEYLWIMTKKYFCSQEILDIIKHIEDCGYNLFLNAVESNTKEILEVTFREIKNIFETTENASIQEYLSCINNDQENILHVLMKSKNSEKLKYFWPELESYFTKQQFKNLLSQRVLEDEHNVLHIAAKCEKIEFHETLWEILLNTFENREELKELIMQGDEDGNNYVHYLVFWDEPEIIEFSIRKIKENFSDEQYAQILKSKGQWENLLQQAACGSKDIKTHQILWKIFRDFYKSDEEFLEFLKEVDNQKNIFHNAACFTSKEIFEFMIHQLEKIASVDEIRNILRTLGFAKRNLLQSAAIQNKSVELHEYLWKIIKKYLNSQEILDMIKHTNDFGYNLLFHVVKSNTKEILELTWKEIKSVLVYNEQVEYLKIKVNNDDLLTVAFRNKRHPDVYDFLKSLLNSFEEKIKYENADVDVDMDTYIDVSEIEEGNNEQKLIEAAKENNPEKVEELIKHLIDVNKEDDCQKTAIDYAWMNYTNFKKSNERSSQASDKIILLLLNANSKFPSWCVGFDSREASSEVRNFIEMCENLHRDMTNGKINHILQVLSENPNLRYFHDRNNETLMLLALKKHNYEILKILEGKISIREDESLQEIFYECMMDSDEEINIKEPKLPPSHILMLQAKFRIINAKDNYNKYFKCIADAFRSIDEIDSCSTILKVAALSKDLKIIFDFSKNTSNDIKYNSGNIYIGAKEIMDVKEKNKVFGVLIHKLCYQALFQTYMNNYNPYPIGNLEAKEKYENIFIKIKQKSIKNHESEDIIKQTFTYEEEIQHAELIVRSIQILVHYREDSAKLNKLQSKYSELFDYVRDVVTQDIEKGLPVLKILQIENRDVMFEELTESMKAKILQSKIVFQGEKSTISDLFDNNEETMNSLSSEDIRRILFKNECLTIGTELKFDTSRWNVDIKFNKYWSSSEKIEKNFETIQDEVKDARVFVFIDEDDSSKTTTFEYFAEALKKANKSAWVSLIKFKDVHEDIQIFKNNRNNVNVKKIFLRILKINSETEVNLFINLYDSGKVIILFERFDEIATGYSELMLCVLKKMKETSRNQIWISTKPNFSKILEDNLKTCVYLKLEEPFARYFPELSRIFK